MAELEITKEERLALRAQCHDLKPLVILGQNGLTDAVLKETAKALDAHGLVKVRLDAEDREERAGEIAKILGSLCCAKIQVIGKTVSIWRPMPEKEEKKPEPARRREKSAKEKNRRAKGPKIAPEKRYRRSEAQRAKAREKAAGKGGAGRSRSRAS